MTFPYDRPDWRAAADLLDQHRADHETVLAPDIFHFVLPHIFREVDTRLNPGRDYDWVVVERTTMGRFDHEFLRRTLPATMRVALANDTLLVWCRQSNHRVPTLMMATPEILSFFAAAHELTEDDARAGSRHDPVLASPHEIVEFATLDDAGLATAMDDFYRHGGYEADTLRDLVLKREMFDTVYGWLGDAAGQSVLDVGCGVGKYEELLTQAASVVAIDISTVAVERARAAHAERAEMRFEVMGAERLDFADNSFDVVLILDAIEHFLRPEVALAEAHRVLRPGGRLVVSSANPDSLHLRMMSKLGHPAFNTSFQHVREFTVGELTHILTGLGLRVDDRASVFLYPYWGIPGVDGTVRHLTDHDPDVVEAMRELGRRAGPEFSYEFALLATKVA